MWISDHKCDVTVRSYVRMTGQMLQLASFFSLMGRIWYSYELNLVVRKNIQIIYISIFPTQAREFFFWPGEWGWIQQFRSGNFPVPRPKIRSLTVISCKISEQQVPEVTNVPVPFKRKGLKSPRHYPPCIVKMKNESLFIFIINILTEQFSLTPSPLIYFLVEST